jgi:hypothetical protein
MFYARLPAALCAGAISTLVLFATQPAGAHDAPSGWTYPLACCSDYDCREVADADVVEGPEGYVIKVTGEVIPMTSRKVRKSPDGVFHRCSVQGKQDSATLCLFVPPRSF